jgi:hypothetical protein
MPVMNNANTAAPEKVLTATRDAAPVVKGMRYAVTEVGQHHYQVRSLSRAVPFESTFTREVFGG